MTTRETGWIARSAEGRDMDRSNLPLIAPQYEARYISANDVLNLLGHGEVPGVNYEDPRIQEIRSCSFSVSGQLHFNEALKAGYVIDRPMVEQRARESLVIAWRWWCTAAGQPFIVVSPDASGYFTVRCDLTSAGKHWNPTDAPQFERILGEVATVYRSDTRFRVDDRLFEITSVEMDDAITIARNLVEYTTRGSFKERESAPLLPPDPFGQLAKPLLPMERSDGG